MSFVKIVSITCNNKPCLEVIDDEYTTNTEAWMAAERQGWTNADPIYSGISKKAVHLCPNCTELMKS